MEKEKKGKTKGLIIEPSFVLVFFLFVSLQQVYFLMDYLRGTRSGHPKHWAGAKKRRFIKLRSHLSLKSGTLRSIIPLNS